MWLIFYCFLALVCVAPANPTSQARAAAPESPGRLKAGRSRQRRPVRHHHHCRLKNQRGDFWSGLVWAGLCVVRCANPKFPAPARRSARPPLFQPAGSPPLPPERNSRVRARGRQVFARRWPLRRAHGALRLRVAPETLVRGRRHAPPAHDRDGHVPEAHRCVFVFFASPPPPLRTADPVRFL